MRSKKVTINEDFYLTILNLLKGGKNPSKIAKELNVSKQKLQYYISKLKAKGLIQKKGYGTWEVKHCNLGYLKLKEKPIRGHAFIWLIKVPVEALPFNWINLLEKRNIKYNLIGKEKYPRIYIKGLKVWLCSRNIVIFEHKSFYANNSIESRKYAIINLLSILHTLERVLSVNLRPYMFKPKREHYGMIKNELARQYNKKGEKLLIHDDLEGDWLWIDDSESLSELEAGGKKAIVRSKQVQDWWNDHKKNNFQLNATKTLEMIYGVTANQQIFDKNMASHISAIQSLAKGVRGLGRAINKVMKENQDLKLKIKHQKTLLDY